MLEVVDGAIDSEDAVDETVEDTLETMAVAADAGAKGSKSVPAGAMDTVAVAADVAARGSEDVAVSVATGSVSESAVAMAFGTWAADVVEAAVLVDMASRSLIGRDSGTLHHLHADEIGSGSKTNV